MFTVVAAADSVRTECTAGFDIHLFLTWHISLYYPEIDDRKRHDKRKAKILSREADFC
jgi:hypothetical protein